MDWNFGSKYIGAGFQRKHWSMLLWSSVGGGDHGCVKYGNFECDLVKNVIKENLIGICLVKFVFSKKNIKKLRKTQHI